MQISGQLVQHLLNCLREANNGVQNPVNAPMIISSEMCINDTVGATAQGLTGAKPTPAAPDV
jgi:hypothetical protein